MISYIFKVSKAVAVEEEEHRRDRKSMSSQKADGLIQ